MTIPDRKRKDQLGKRNCSRNIGRPCTEEDEFTSIVKNWMVDAPETEQFYSFALPFIPFSLISFLMVGLEFVLKKKKKSV